MAKNIPELQVGSNPDSAITPTKCSKPREGNEGFEKIKLRFLQSSNGVALTKQQQPDGSLASEPRVKFYRQMFEVEFDGISKLAEFMDSAVEQRDIVPTTAQLTADGRAAMERGEGIRRKFISAPDEGYEKPHVEEAASRVLLIDFDGILTADTTWRDDLGEFARGVVDRFLPATFKNVTFWTSLSSSAGLKRDGENWLVGIHAIFVSAQALTGAIRRGIVELDKPEVDPTLGVVDSKTLSCKQLFYTARPILRSEDPAPVRSCLVERKFEFIEVSDEMITKITNASKLDERSSVVGDGVLRLARGYEEKMAFLGDGNGLYGFHEVMRDGIYAYAADQNGKFDRGPLKNDIRSRINEAPKLSSRKTSDLTRYKSDAYLDDSIEGAIRRVATELYAPRGFKPPEGTIDTTRLEIDDFVMSFEALVARSDDVAESDYRDRVLAGQDPLVWGMETPTGSGKTKSAIETASRLVRCHGKRVVFSVPTHKLADELVERFSDLGVLASTYRGVSATDPVSPKFNMCRMSVEAELLRSGGGAISLLCDCCKFVSICGYQRQMGQKSVTQVWIMPHNLIAYVRPTHTIPPCDVLFVDEDPLDAFLVGFDGRGETITPKELWVRAGEVDSSLARGRRRLSDMIRKGEVNSALFGFPKSIRKMVLKEVRQIKRGTPVHVALRIAKVNQRLLLEAAAWGNIAEGGIGLKIVDWISDEAVKEQRLSIFRRKKVAKDWLVPTLLMDATPEWTLYRKFWPIDHIRSFESDMPNVTVRQILWSGSAQKLKSGPHAAANISKVRRYIEARAGLFESVLVVAQMAVEEKLINLGLPANVEVTHFNATRGIDRWKHVDLLIQIGRTEPPPENAELMTEVFFQEKIDRLTPGSYYPFHRVGLCVRNTDEMTPAVDAAYHPDPRVEMIRKRVCSSELIQTLGRGRGVNRNSSDPLQVDLIHKVPLRIAIDEIITWTAAQPTQFEVIAGRYGIEFLSLSARGITAAVRALAPDGACSKQGLWKARGSNSPEGPLDLVSNNSQGGVDRERKNPPDMYFPVNSRISVPVRFSRYRWRELVNGEKPPVKVRTFRFGKFHLVRVPDGPGNLGYLSRPPHRTRRGPRPVGAYDLEILERPDGSIDFLDPLIDV
jgi:hypothetical protein